MSRRHPVRACAVASAAVSFVFLSASFAYAQLFQPPTFQSSGVEGQVLTASLADLNRDGRQDMVVSLRPTATDPVAFAVFYSTPEGFTHVATVNFPVAGTTMTRMTLADLDRDGQQDLVAAASDQVAVFWGSGDAGVFGSVPTMIAGFFGVRDVAVADFNGDGRGDLAVADTNGSTTVWVVPAAAGRLFGTPVGLLDGGVARPMDIAVGDVDADGRIDVVGVSSPSTITVVRNQGAFQFAPAVANVVLASPSTLASSLAVADVNGDGKADATAFDGGSALVTALSVGDGSLTVAGRQSIPNPFSAELTIDDLNGDGFADLLIGATNRAQVAILLGRGDGTFLPATLFSANGYHDLTTGDVNGDGARDIVGVSDGVITVALHVTPLTVAISASAGTAGADGFAAVTATASSGDYTGVSFTWFVDGNSLASGPTLTTRLGPGEHVLLVRAVTSTGLHASASTTLSIAGAPASQTSVNTIQQTLDADDPGQGYICLCRCVHG